MSNNKAVEAVITYAKYTNPVLYGIYELSRKSAEAYIKVQESGNVNDMASELDRQRIELEFAKIQACIQQELAIAKRIEDAEEVEIEEYYDLSGKGKAGLDIKEDSIDLGLSAEGSKVSKRIYRFKSKSSTENVE